MSHVQLWNQNELEWVVLGDIYGYLTAEDRRPEGTFPIDCDQLTGLPKNEAPKILRETLMGPDGKAFVHEIQTPGSLILPTGLARGGVALAAEMTLFAGSEDPAGGRTPGLAGDHLVRIEGGKRRRLSTIPGSQWSQDELSTWRDYAFAIRKTFMYWARLNLVDPQPVLYEFPEPLGIDGLPRVIRPRWRLLDLARQVIPGTRYANRPKSILHDLDPHERLRQPQYAQESFAKEAGGSVAPILTTDTPKEEPCPSTTSGPELSGSSLSSRTTLPTPESSASDSTKPSAPASAS